jgi:hypothetical protein
MGPPYRSLASILSSGVGLVAILTIGLFVYWANFKKAAAKLNNTTGILIISIPAILLTITTSFIDPSGELLKTIMGYGILLFAGLALAGAVFGLLFILFSLVRWVSVSGLPMSGNIEDPNFFEEMQWILGDILRPLGFTLFRQDHQGQKYADFTKGEFHVSLSWEDKICWLYLLDKPDISDDKKRHKPDLTIKCSNVRKSEEFKSESITKLNGWLIEKKLK